MGIIRFFLAISVLASHGALFHLHLFDRDFSSAIITGRTAVVLFYIISGFYMALILNIKYVGKNRLQAFYTNRFLRLWPTYILILILTSLYFSSFSDIFARLAAADAGILTKCFVLFSNFFIIGSDIFPLISITPDGIIYDPVFLSDTSNGHTFLVIGVIFTIGIEMVFYMLAPFFVTSVKKTLWVLGFGLLYHIIIAWLNYSNVITAYHAFPATLLYFSLGSIAYHLYAKNIILKHRKNILVAIVVALLLLFVPLVTKGWLIVIFTLALPTIFNLTKKNTRDRMIGELSYPIYLVHIPVIRAFKDVGLPDNLKSLYAHIFTIVFAIMIYALFERPIDKYRQVIARKIIIKKKEVIKPVRTI